MGAADLPPNILAKINKKYAGKEIFGVTEITSDSEANLSDHFKG